MAPSQLSSSTLVGFGYSASGRVLLVSTEIPGPIVVDKRDLAEVATLGSTRLQPDDLIHRREIVLGQLLGAEGRFADDEVQIGMPVDPELDLAALDVADRFRDVDGDCSGLRVGHQPAGAESAAEATNFAHHVGRRHDGVEVQVSLRDLVDQLIGAHLVGPSRNRGFGALAGGEHQHPCRLARAIGEVDGAADHLIRLTRIDPESH